MKTLDVVIPTFNRCEQVKKTIESLLSAKGPEDLKVTAIVVDNNSTDRTEEIVRSFESTPFMALTYVKEQRQGCSFARNRGIREGSGELIGFIDDDEQVCAKWFEVVACEFRDPTISYIGGPCVPVWEVSAPDWLPPGYNSAIGVVAPKEYGEFSEGFRGILMGGNAVLRRSVFEQVGLYSTELGRTDKKLLSEEDAEFYRRLLRSGLRGLHVPDLVIHHYVPARRLTRKYHRSWCFWRGVSQGVLDRKEQQAVAYLAGVPRYLFGRALRGLLGFPYELIRGKYGEAFASELASWDLAGFLYGKHWYKVEQSKNVTFHKLRVSG